MVKADADKGIAGLDTTCGHRVAAQTGTTVASFLQKASDTCTSQGKQKVDVRLFAKDSDALQQLSVGLVDAYGTTVETETFKERPDGSVRIDVTIYVARAGHKAILIGERGSKVKMIGARARQELIGLLDRPVHLFLNVKERSGWDEEGARLRAIGLEDPG